nr:hypothetical protein [Nanoarchaeota archaeon]
MTYKVFQNKLNHKTKKFDLEIFYKSRFIDVKEVIVNKEKFSEMCKQGCGVYKGCWACPPYSPSFLDLKDNFKKMFVFISCIYTNQIRIKNPYLVLFNIYNILGPRMYRLGMVLEKPLNGLLLKSGPCRVCRECSVINREPCKFPNKKRYALESTGVDVQKLAMLLKHELLWYNKKSLPKYMSVVCGVLTNKKILQEDVYKDFKKLFI